MHKILPHSRRDNLQSFFYYLYNYTGEQTQVEEQKYDGKIKFSDGKVLSIEIRKPIDGRNQKKHALELNENGFSMGQASNAFEEAISIINKIISTAAKKAEKHYQSLVVVIYATEMNAFRNLDDSLHNEIRIEVVKKLTNIKFNAKAV